MARGWTARAARPVADRTAGTTGRARWLLAGQDLLRRGGTPAVKLDALTRSTGLTTGSFYHHFDGMDDYLEALAGYYGVEQVDDFLRGLADLAPLEQLHALSRLSVDERMRPLDAAMRDWAGSNPVAAEAVRNADAALLGFMVAALVALGHAEGEARARAVVLLSLGTARVRPPWPVDVDDVRWIVDFVATARSERADRSGA